MQPSGLSQRTHKADPEQAGDHHRSRAERRRDVRELNRNHAHPSAGGFTWAVLESALIPVLGMPISFFLINCWSSVVASGCVATVCAISTVIFGVE